MSYFKDAMRAQYYLPIISKHLKPLLDYLYELKQKWVYLDIDEIQKQFLISLGGEADQILLPVIANELYLAKCSGVLQGNTSAERYDSFFLKNGKWTVEAKHIPQKYPFLFEMLNRLVQTSVENIRECLVRLENDANALFHWAGIDVKRLVTIQTSGGDRHRGGRQVLVLTFGESKVVYKPTYLYADQLYAEFVNLLALHPPYDLRSAQILPRNGYGWLEFIDFVPCKSEHEVRSYYQRAGALLAVADTLNYCDGHFENLIAHGAYPVLIDCETLFHAFGSVQDFGGERSIFFTGLIQPLVGEEPIKRGLSAAFQVYGGKRNHILHTYAVEDHTDNLQVRFRGSTEETSFNSAVYDGSFQWAGKYVAEVVDGYRTTYDRITSCSTLILNNSDWWKKLSVVHVRQLVRHTMYYLFVLRKLQQPESCVDETTAREVIRALLGSEDHKANQLIAYEINDLVNNDIPYFYHYPGERNLYDSAGKCYSGFFEQSVTDEIRTQLETRSDTYRNRQVEIIEKHLPLSPLRIE